MSQPHWNSNEFHVPISQDTLFTNQSAVAAPGSPLAISVSDINIAAGATAATWKLLNGSGGTVVWSVALAIGQSWNVHLQVPIKLTSNTALCITSSIASVGAFIDVGGFIGRG